MTADKPNRSTSPRGQRRRRRSMGAEIFARTLADRRVLIRKLVVGEALGERPTQGLAVRPPTGEPESD